MQETGLTSRGANTRTTLEDDNLLETIVRNKQSLRKSDRKVAELILAKPAEVLEMTLATLAREAEVSEPTVIRFCAAIGCAGFRDLRVKLATSLAYSRTTSHIAVSVEDGLPTVVKKMFDYNLANLSWAQSHLDVQQLEDAVETLTHATRIEFFGLGASGMVARDAQQKFPLFGVPCGTTSDAHQMFMTADTMSVGEAAVMISNTGTTPEIVETAKIVRRRGATAIGLSGSESPLLAHCDVKLVVETLENTALYTPTVSRLSHLVIVDILSTCVSFRKGDAHAERLVRMKRGLAELKR